MVTDPGATPPMLPEGSILTVEGSEVLHAPPGIGSVSVAVLPTHTEDRPAIAGNAADTVTGAVALQPPGSA